MPASPEHLTLTQIESQLSPSAKLALQVIESLSDDETLLCQQFLNTKYPLRTKLFPNIQSNEIPSLEATQKVLTAPDVAKLLQLHPTTTADMAAAGRFPGAFKVGREWAIPVTALTNFERKKRGRPKKIG